MMSNQDDENNLRSSQASQTSLVSRASSQHSHRSAHSQPRSRTSTAGSSAGVPFFADMVLDFSEAATESTPRTDLKFASMAGTAGGDDRRPIRDELIAAVPPLPSAAASPADDSDARGHDRGAATEGAAAGAGASLARIESGAPFGPGEDLRPRRPARPPRRPRDVSWIAAALLVVPAGLLLPPLVYSKGYVARHNATTGVVARHPSWSRAVLAPPARPVVLASALVAALVAAVLLRSLHASPGGGEGDDVRHVTVTRAVLLPARASRWVHPLLAAGIWVYLPRARWGALLPLGLLVRDCWWVRRGGSFALPVFSRGRRTLDGRVSLGNGTGAAGLASSSSHERRTFFRALAVAALDVISRSLRRRSFVRVASLLLLLQLLVAVLWWEAVGAVLSVRAFEGDGVATRLARALWLALALVAGKWATAIVARLLGFVAAGSVASWFGAQQAVIVDRMEREAATAVAEQQQLRQQQQGQRQQQGPAASSDKALEPSSERADAVTEANGDNAVGAAIDASYYASATDFDEGLDDDYDDDAEEEDRHNDGRRYRSLSTMHAPVSSSSEATVKSFVTAGCTVSFGSVAQCGLLGGVAQFLWSLVRRVDNATAVFVFLRQQRRRRLGRSGNPPGFRGMNVAVDESGDANPADPRQQCRRIDVATREFVRSHSDLAMSHVAVYFKSYQRAANDVGVLIETSGLESIIHDDISTHMCSSVGHLVAGSIVLFFGMLLVTHRNTFAASTDRLTDTSILEILLFSYALCYTILFTALEPLRAAIKAMYVCFAEHPLSVSQAFPLIYQRLSRISEAVSSQ